jgi:small nuclear ribonucleoprotein (snRNP)-like protein
MNVQLLDSEEYIDGSCKGTLGEILIRYNLFNNKIDVIMFYIFEKYQKKISLKRNVNKF